MGRFAPFRRNGRIWSFRIPSIVLGEQRALFRVVDLSDLACLVDRLKQAGFVGENQDDV